MPDRTYSSVTEEDIQALVKKGCSSDDWNRVLVCEGTDLGRVSGVVFSGEVRIGELRGEIEMSDGVKRASGIFNANLHNVRIGDNCVVSNVTGWLSCLDVEESAVIENVATIACTGETTFGNGHEISVLNEEGGRELRITTETSAQTAYLAVLYRERKDLVEALNNIADRFCAGIKRNRAVVGKGARVRNCNEIINVQIGAFSVIDGALSLKEGSIVSSEETPTIVGQGVIAERFIFQRGSSIEDGAMVRASLVGEGTRIGKQFSCENSVFFANSEGFHSEACSVFGGPYTVTHHRSTILIAALFSFYNAGSGTNQSNHMYKLGPVHQGILERGCKTGSSSYLLWPSRVGAFTVIMGKHYANFDTSDFPFSYIDEEDGKSTLVPGMNFFTVGTLRDADKWPSRDRRGSGRKLDLIVFDVLTPFTAQKMMNGSRILIELRENSGKDQEYVTWKGIRIKRLLLKRCSRYYKLVLDKYFGDILVGRIENALPARLRDALKGDNTGPGVSGEWIDVSGLICCKSRIDGLISQVVSGGISTFEDLHESFRRIYESYKADEWLWFLREYEKLTNCRLCDETDENLRGILSQWKESSLKLLNMVLNDARKEYEGNARIGFGIDGNGDADFEAVRGTFNDHRFVKRIRKDMEDINRRYDAVCRLMARLEEGEL